MLTRRDFAKKGAICGGALLAGFDRVVWPSAPLDPARRASEEPFSGGKKLGLVEFIDEPTVEMEKALGTELDGRLYTDLSSVSLEERITPTDKFYIRTRASEILPNAKSWRVHVDGHVDKPWSQTIEDLKRAAKPRGLHLMECAGNVAQAHFGLISVASWAGVPIAEILDNTAARPQASRVLVAGFDQYATKSRTSVPGASWIFTLKELKAAQAFLATEMNDQLLTPDHGAPIRLVVPGWYGCTCIKWVERITFVGESVEPTSQMQEYAGRTHQRGMPALVREFQPAIIDPAAMPIRIEKWSVEGKIKYRVVGIAWGGTTPVKNLKIRFNPEEEYVQVEQFEQTKNDPWTFWTHTWSPKEPGKYSVRLTIGDPGVRTRRLDSGYYVRTVEISEV
ncbi:MAG TPA: molybdopterin-dependent oxidoreductase [Candidatus Acidoferrum sp.]|nr:molybdopterin-dependent oxidoreductase [Candidatus Acidoferrum sp.]